MPALGKRSAQAKLNEPGRRRQGSAPNGRDSARSAGRNPRTRRRHAGTQLWHDGVLQLHVYVSRWRQRHGQSEIRPLDDWPNPVLQSPAQ
ncbi:TPA: hypothetical protein L5667_002092 [Pseudomonas aeruginosa]|nr:hypothetical protein [Pseudomonas aeruginosa]